VRFDRLLDRAAPVLLLGVTLVWGLTFVVVQRAVAHFGAIEFLAIRFALASLVLAPFFLRGTRRHEVRVGLGLGLLLALGFLFQTWGLRATTVTQSGFVTGLFVIFAPLFAGVLFGVGLRPRNYAAIGLSAIGLFLLLGGPGFAWNIGDTLTLACALCFGLHIALLSHFSPSCRTGPLTFTQIASQTLWLVLLLPAGAPLGNPFTGSLVGALLLTGLVASAGAFYIQTRVQKRLSAARTAVILTAEPLFAALFGYLLNHETPTAIELAGGVLIFLAMLVSEVGLGGWPQSRPA
jgi:drug/metabolite transporter (DMT)-like permease